MILAQSVQNRDGLIVAGSDTKLTKGTLDYLRDSGVAFITVRGRPVEDIAPGDYNSLIENLELMFRHSQGNKFMKSMEGILKKHFETKLTEAKATKQDENEKKSEEQQEGVAE